jgi:hypothetical protein
MLDTEHSSLEVNFKIAKEKFNNALIEVREELETVKDDYRQK